LEKNTAKRQVCARVEHVFGLQANGMGAEAKDSGVIQAIQGHGWESFPE